MASQFVTTTLFGNRTQSYPDVVLLCPHDGGHEHFLGVYPEIARACPAPWETLRTYLAVERDVGSTDLAHAIARAIEARMPDLRTEVLSIHIPRGILDGNRVAERAIRMTFDHPAYPELVSVLLGEHRHALTAVARRLSFLVPRGIFVDVHSMAPYTPRTTPGSPTEAAVETPTTLAAYTAAYRDRTHWGARRSLDVVTAVAGTTEHIVDSKLLAYLQTELATAGISFRENDPYPTAEHVLTTHRLREHRGICIDVPKDFLGTTPAENPAFDLATITVSPERAARIAAPIARAISAALPA